MEKLPKQMKLTPNVFNFSFTDYVRVAERLEGHVEIQGLICDLISDIESLDNNKLIGEQVTKLLKDDEELLDFSNASRRSVFLI